MALKPPNIRSKVRTQVKDKGYKAIIKELRILENRPYVKVGFPSESPKTKEDHKDEDGKSSGLTVLDVAVFSEFGTEKTPERSFMRASHDDMVPEMKTLIARCMKAVYEGRITVSRALGIMGITAERNTKKFLTDNKVKPPSKKSDSASFSFTPVKSGSSRAPVVDVKRRSMKTLIDTAQMLNSITHIKIMNGKGRK